MDEEHENTYKQQDPAPRYHARNAAIVLAIQQGAKVLLGTATPSLETWHNAQTGKYALATLTQRHQAVRLPQVLPVDIKELTRKKRMNGPFSPLLLQYVREALERQEQIILVPEPARLLHLCWNATRAAGCPAARIAMSASPTIAAWAS